MTIDKQKLKALAESPRCGASWPQFESVCGKTKSGKSTWQCGECARNEARDLREKLEKYFGLYKDADEHVNHWQRQSRSKARLLKTAEQQCDQLKAENEALRNALQRISAEVDGNIREAVRDCVNCRGDANDIYGYCDSIDQIIDAAMAKEASHG